MKTLAKIFSLVVCSFLLLSNVAFADGMIVPPPGYYMQETQQKAVIFQENNIETMVVTVAFEGSAKDFVWLIPTPTKPEVSKSSTELFTSLETLTGYYYPMYDRGVMSAPMAAESNSGVSVIETKKVDYYDVTVLTSDDRDALVKWLNDNKYPFPEEEKYILNDYIDNNWFFVAMKIDASALKSDVVEQQLYSGNATPVKLVFESKNIVFPLKISSVIVNKDKINQPEPYPVPMLESAPMTESGSAPLDDVNINTGGSASSGVSLPDSVTTETTIAPDYYPYPYYGANITLYVISDHKKELTNFNTDYAAWVKKDVIEKWATDTQGNPWVTPTKNKYYLTKLSRYMDTSEMTSDLFPQNADNNKTIGVNSVSFELVIKFIIFLLLFIAIFGGVIIFSPFGLAFIACALVQFLSKSRIAHKICFVIQLIVIIVSAFLFLTAIALGMFDFSGLKSVFYGSSTEDKIMILAIFIDCIATIIAMIATLVLQQKYHVKSLKDYKKVK